MHFCWEISDSPNGTLLGVNYVMVHNSTYCNGTQCNYEIIHYTWKDQIILYFFPLLWSEYVFLHMKLSEPSICTGKTDKYCKCKKCQSVKFWILILEQLFIAYQFLWQYLGSTCSRNLLNCLLHAKHLIDSWKIHYSTILWKEEINEVKAFFSLKFYFIVEIETETMLWAWTVLYTQPAVLGSPCLHRNIHILY